MLYSLHAVNVKDGTVALAYYFNGETSRDTDAWEAALYEETRGMWSEGPAGGVITTSVAGTTVAVHRRDEAVFLLAGDASEDELSLCGHLPLLTAIITAVCEDRLTTQQITTFHGKVVQCLYEAYPQGTRRLTNPEAVLRAAKLKSFT